jgi:Spy/CpxP family protein refolding chaperone
MRLVPVFAALLIVWLAVSLASAAPQSSKMQAEQAREAVRADKKRVVTENMEFTEAEAKAFWPLYDEYQKAQEEVGDRMTDLIKNYGLVHKVMTDDAAAAMLKKMIAIQGDRVKLMEEYLPKFEKVLPTTKVARYYQIENKYRAALDYEISKQIPLAE